MPDALGIGLLAGGVGVLSLAIVEAPDWGWGVGARAAWRSRCRSLLLGAFVWRSRGASRIRCWSWRCSACGRSRSACAGVFMFSLGFYAVLLANILFLTGVWGYSVLEAGVAVTPGPLMAALSSALAGRVIDRYGQRVTAVPGGLLFALGCVLFAVGLGSSPAYVTEFLPATLLTGAGVGLSFASFSLGGGMELPPARFATGSAISSCFRQLGAVLGISVLIAVIGSAPVLADFHARLLADGGDRSDRRVDRADARPGSRYRPGMDLEERTLDDTIARTCAVCGAELTTQEIKDAREVGGPFLCTVHAMEEAPGRRVAATTPPERAPASRSASALRLARGARRAA